MEKKTVYLVDGTNLLYRAFFAIRMLNSPSGQPSNAIYGMATMLLKLISDYKPDTVVVAFDKGKNTFRNQLYSEYKGTRQETPIELSEQFEPAKEFIRFLGIPIFESDSYEADDIIGTLSCHAPKQGWKARIVSGDKDLLQLINEDTEVLLVRKGMTDLEMMNIPAFQAHYGIRPDAFVDVKALMGDSSDNIPGVPGVGEKTALKLIQEYGSLDKVYENIDQISGKKLKENLDNHKKEAKLSFELAKIECAMPLDVDFEKEMISPNWAEIKKFFEHYGFKSLIKKIPVGVVDVFKMGQEDLFQGEMHYEKNLPKNWISEVIEKSTEKNPLIVIPVYREEFPRQRWGSIAVYWNEKSYLISKDQKDWGQVLRAIQHEKVKKATWKSKDFYRSAFSYEFEIKGNFWDIHIGAYLLKPGEGGLDEKSIWEEYGEGKIPIEPAELEEKAVWQAMVVGKVFTAVQKKLEEFSQWNLFTDIESPLAEVLALLEWNGIQVDAKKMTEMANEFSKRIQESAQIIYDAAGEVFNVNSPKQLGYVLFEKLQLPILKKTKTGLSTDIEVLEELASHHPIAKELVNYRQLSKLKSTYLDALPALINDRTGRLHTTFHQTVTATGRLSSSNPNLQNIPIRTEEGKRIRYFFVPGKNFNGILSADYSQIELRILAYIAHDESMQKAFIDGEDIHARTAAEVFGVSLDHVTRQMRSNAKAVNFGIVYGISDYSLSRDIGVTRKEAGEYIEKYFTRYPKIKVTIEGLVQSSRDLGYSETLYGRRRYIPDIRSSNYNRRSFAERIAMNMPIQGTAADIIKKAMIDIRKEMKTKNMKSKMVLQVHDELVFEYLDEELSVLKKIIQECMENAVKFDVPLKVDIAVGPNWAEAK